MELLVAQMFLLYCQRLEPLITLQEILDRGITLKDGYVTSGLWVNEDYYCSVLYRRDINYLIFKTET